jgi:hypothetical protein
MHDTLARISVLMHLWADSTSGPAGDAPRTLNPPEAQLVEHHERAGGDDAAHAAALDDQPQLGVVGALPRAAAGLGAPPRQLDRRVRDLQMSRESFTRLQQPLQLRHLPPWCCFVIAM